QTAHGRMITCVASTVLASTGVLQTAMDLGANALAVHAQRLHNEIIDTVLERADDVAWFLSVPADDENRHQMHVVGAAVGEAPAYLAPQRHSGLDAGLDRL